MSQLPPAASLQRSDEVVAEIEKITMAQPEIEYTTVVTGYSMLTGSYAPSNAFIFISLKPWDEREYTALEIVQRLNMLFAQQIKAGQVVAFGPPAIPGLGKGGGFSFMIQDRAGNTPQYLADNTMKFIQAANARPEIAGAFTTFQANVPQRFMDIDREKALKLGVSLNDLYQTVGAFMGGTYVNDFTRFGRLYKTYIQAEPEYRVDEDQIGNFFMKNKDGNMVPLSTIATVTPTAGPDYTTRFNLYRAVEVTGSPAPGFTSTQAMDALEEVAAEQLPPDMTYSWNAMSYQEKQASGSLGAILIFSLVFVFLILAAQYESWSLPWSILLGTPFALFGALLALFVARLYSPTFENNIFAQVSFVMLIGMAAKNAILIVEYATEEFKGGLSLFDAAIKAARERLPSDPDDSILIHSRGVPTCRCFRIRSRGKRKVMGMALLGGMTLGDIAWVYSCTRCSMCPHRQAIWVRKETR